MPSMAELCRVTSDSRFDIQGEEKSEQHWRRTLTCAACIFCHICFICFAVSESTVLTLASDATNFTSGERTLGRTLFQRPQGTIGSTNKKYTTAVAEAEDLDTSEQGVWGEEASSPGGFAEVLPTLPKTKQAPGSEIETGTRLPSRHRARKESASSVSARTFWPPFAQTVRPTGVRSPFTERKAGTPDAGSRGALELERVNALSYEQPWSPTQLAQREEGMPSRRIQPPSVPGRDLRPSLETWAHTEEQRRPGVTEELRRLPPVEGKKTLMATALLYLVGWMSLPWALGAAGIGLFRALRSSRKREATLMRALARTRNPKASELAGFQ